MASKQQELEDPAFLSAASNFSSFLDTIAEDSNTSVSRIENIDQFKEVINGYISQLRSDQLEIPQGVEVDNIDVIGGIIMANLCRKKLQEIVDSDSGNISDLAVSRMNAFFNKEFIENFGKAIPFRSHGDTGEGEDPRVIRRRNQATATAVGSDMIEEEDESDGSYTKFYNSLFSATQKRFKWRDEIFTSTSNDLQCLRAMGMSDAGSNVSEIHNSGRLDCYICGGKLWRYHKWIDFEKTVVDGQDKMQCEHILPIITAIANWWLVKPTGSTPRDLVDSGEYTQAQVELLSYEYAWSHRCCNLVKNNFEFIKFVGETLKCEPDVHGIYNVLKAIYEGSFEDETGEAQFDCLYVDYSTSPNDGKYYDRPFNEKNHKQGILQKLFKPGKKKGTLVLTAYGEERRQAIIERLKPLTDIISSNMKRTNDYQLYNLLCKFKIMSAIDDDNFKRLLLDLDKSEDVGKALVSQKQRIINDALEAVKTSINEYNDLINEYKEKEKEAARILEISSMTNKKEKEKREKEEEKADLERKIERGDRISSRSGITPDTINVKIQELEREITELRETFSQQQGKLLEIQDAIKNFHDSEEGIKYDETSRKWLDYTKVAIKNFSQPNMIIRLNGLQLIVLVPASSETVQTDINSLEKAFSSNEGESQEQEQESDDSTPMDLDEDSTSDGVKKRKRNKKAKEQVESHPTEPGQVSAEADEGPRRSKRNRKQTSFFEARRGGRVLRDNSSLDIINPSVVVPNPDVKSDPSVIIPNPDMKPKVDIQVLPSDASGSELTKSKVNDTDYNIKLFISTAINGETIKGTNFYFGPTDADVKNELIKLFMKPKVDNSISLNEKETKKGGKTKKTRKRRGKKRKTKKRKTKKQKTKRRKSRRRNKSTKKRRKRRKN